MLKAEEMTTNRNGPIRLYMATSECEKRMRLCEFCHK